MTELLLRDGDYVPDGKGGLVRAEGAEALLQWVLFQLSVRRGSFPFLPEVGSRLYLLGRERPSARESLARQYVSEALAGEQDLEVTGVTLAEEEPGHMQLRTEMEWRGETLAVSLLI